MAGVAKLQSQVREWFVLPDGTATHTKARYTQLIQRHPQYSLELNNAQHCSVISQTEVSWQTHNRLMEPTIRGPNFGTYLSECL